MDNTRGSAIDSIRENQTKFERDLSELKTNVSDYQTPTMNELNRISDLLESSLSIDQVRHASIKYLQNKKGIIRLFT